MFEWLITRPMGFIISHIYDIVHNYGLAIIIFTVIIKLILLPLNVKSQKSMKKQQKIQPYVMELQKKYANDQEKLQREMMKLYRDNNVSMAGGCLPILIQMPILVGLYTVIRMPLSFLLGVNFMEQATIDKVYALRDAMAASIGNLATATEEMIANQAQIQLSRWSEIVNGINDPWVINFNFCGLDLSSVPSTAINYIMRADFSQPAIIALLLIPVLAVLSSLLSMKISQAQSGQNLSENDSANQMNKSMMLMMPVMTGIFTFTLPSGMGLYWIISSVMQVLQQVILNRYLDKKGEDIIVTIPEKNSKHKGKKR